MRKQNLETKPLVKRIDEFFKEFDEFDKETRDFSDDCVSELNYIVDRGLVPLLLESKRVIDRVRDSVKEYKLWLENGENENYPNPYDLSDGEKFYYADSFINEVGNIVEADDKFIYEIKE